MNFIKIEHRDRFVRITLCNPEKLNALSRPVLAELDRTFEETGSDRAILVAVLTGEGKAFAAGADISEMRRFSPDDARDFARYGQEVLSRIEASRVVTIAAVNGFALGGGLELALACDIRICSNTATFGQPGLRLGVIPGWGGTGRLAQVIGLGRAKAMLFSGEPIDAKAAYDYGLVTGVYPPEQLFVRADELAEKIAAMSPVALTQVKRTLNPLDRLSDVEAFVECFASGETAEGFSAFLENREPNWKTSNP